MTVKEIRMEKALPSSIEQILPNSSQSQIAPPLEQERPILVNGNQFDRLPEDLYIPPDALEIILEIFSGPLDLLLYLIRKNNLDILDIPIAEITLQYMSYVELMKAFRLDLAADYLVMAAMLAEIKSRMLLPKPPAEEAVEQDPRAELVRRLQEYERFKAAAENLTQMPRMGRDIFLIEPTAMPFTPEISPPKIELQQVVNAFLDILRRSELLATHKITIETLSVRERMIKILDMLSEQSMVLFESCFELAEGRMGLVVSFLAILELAKESLIEIIQNQAFGAIQIKAKEDGEFE
jgi:segregation and condensation protein A